MKLPFKRSKPKQAQAADVLAAGAKLWSELQLVKRAGKGVRKGSKKASSAKSAVGSKARTTPAKVAGILALLGGAGALIARKLKGGGPEPLPYVPPEPPPGDSADSAPLAALAPDRAGDEPPIVVEPTPIVLEDLATENPDTGEPAEEEPETDEPAGEEPDTDEPAGEEPAADEPASEGPGADEFADDEPR